MVLRVGGTSARAEHRLRGPDGNVGDAADVAAVLDGGGDQLAQAAEQHDHELAGRRGDRAQQTVSHALHTVELLRRMDEIRLDRAIVDGNTGLENALLKPPNDAANSAPVRRAILAPGARYEKVFREAGIGSPAETPAATRGVHSVAAIER